MVSDEAKLAVKHAKQYRSEGGQTMFQALPSALVQVISTEAWSEELDKQGKPFTSFRSWVEHPGWWGLGVRWERLCDWVEYAANANEGRPVKGAVECWRLLATMNRVKTYGSNQFTGGGVDGAKSSGAGGTSKCYLLGRLLRDHPELAERVISGELSAHAAALEAGIKKRPDPVRQIARLIPKLNPAQLAEVRQMLEPL